MSAPPPPKRPPRRDEFGRVIRDPEVDADNLRRTKQYAGATIAFILLLLFGLAVFHVWGVGKSMWLPLLGETKLAQGPHARHEGEFTVEWILVMVAVVLGMGAAVYAAIAVHDPAD